MSLKFIGTSYTIEGNRSWTSKCGNNVIPFPFGWAGQQGKFQVSFTLEMQQGSLPLKYHPTSQVKDLEAHPTKAREAPPPAAPEFPRTSRIRAPGSTTPWCPKPSPLSSTTSARGLPPAPPTAPDGSAGAGTATELGCGAATASGRAERAGRQAGGRWARSRRRRAACRTTWVGGACGAVLRPTAVAARTGGRWRRVGVACPRWAG